MNYIQITSSTDLSELNKFRPYKCVIIADKIVPKNTQWKISESLVNTGCYYMMAWGENCSSWDDSVDEVNIMKFIDLESIPNKEFVYTSWHHNEDLEEVFWFCKNCANHKQHSDMNTILIHIGSTQSKEQIINTYNKA